MFIIHYIFLYPQCLFIGLYKIMNSLITQLFFTRKLKLDWMSVLDYMMLEKLHSPFHILVHFLMWYWIFMDIGTCFHKQNISLNCPYFLGNFKEYLCDTGYSILTTAYSQLHSTRIFPRGYIRFTGCCSVIRNIEFPGTFFITAVILWLEGKKMFGKLKRRF